MFDNFTNHSDCLGMNVSWVSEDLELYENQSSLETALVLIGFCTITQVLGIIVQRSCFRLLKRLPDRAINSIIYPNMVKGL